ncbi:hypothetical protein LVJ94_41130 [Pendulispora rubella]|uniref:Secreted protein n=1 Tax=Pendulispora rubella TaxID=2741070 RepID=A0ABZ2KX69_9BACT
MNGTNRWRTLLCVAAALSALAAVGSWLVARPGPSHASRHVSSEPSALHEEDSWPPVPRLREPEPAPQPAPQTAPRSRLAGRPAPAAPHASPPSEVAEPAPFPRGETASELDDPPIRDLVTVGDIALGVRDDPRRLVIHDEPKLKEALTRIGHELEERARQHPEEGAAELVERLADYRDELGDCMSGDVQIRGPHWTIETEAGPALPPEKWWRPKP